MRKFLLFFVFFGVGIASSINQKDVFKSLLNEALREKYSMQIYCIPPTIRFFAPLTQNDARDVAREKPYGQSLTTLYTYEQYKDKLQDFIANHNLSILKESKNKRGHNTCVVDFMREGKIIHTFSFEGYYAEKEGRVSKLFIDDKTYLWNQAKAIRDFRAMFCPYPKEFEEWD